MLNSDLNSEFEVSAPRLNEHADELSIEVHEGVNGLSQGTVQLSAN